jgi:hypothetical protein
VYEQRHAAHTQLVRFVVQQVVQQINNKKTHNKSNEWSLRYTEL